MQALLTGGRALRAPAARIIGSLSASANEQSQGGPQVESFEVTADFSTEVGADLYFYYECWYYFATKIQPWETRLFKVYKP
ncbi:MAG: hypothetical protein CME06_04625 [Gemmatimonadetes bacterium]|nr:hypothetical protein [Gemmatimonadota bacterium]